MKPRPKDTPQGQLPNLLLPVSIIGNGPALDALVNVLAREDLSRFFPRVRLAGWVPYPDSGSGPPKIPAALEKTPVYEDVPSLFAARPDIAIAADVSPDARHMPLLRQTFPSHVSLVSAAMVSRFCSVIEEGRLHISGMETSASSQQKLFSLLVDQVRGDMLILDGDCIILDVNRHLADSLHLAASEIIGLSCKELNRRTGFCVCEEDSCPYLRARETGKEAVRTFSRVTAEGRVSYVEITCHPIEDKSVDSVFYLYIQRDVTERHSLELRLQQTEKMAAIGELATYVAHEIRNPLFAIGGFANALLRNTSLNDIAREKARIIYDESRRLDVILTNILNFARPTAQTIREFDAGRVARQTMELMTMGSGERHIDCALDIETGLPKALGNTENLKQCLVNIIKNALEAMPRGGRLGLRALRDGNYVRIDVADTGEGIKPEAHDQIFNPFYSTKNSGSGLGLAMTRKVIEEMGGKVTLESMPGEGTTISLFIPVALAVDSEPANIADGAPA